MTAMQIFAQVWLGIIAYHCIKWAIKNSSLKMWQGVFWAIGYVFGLIATGVSLAIVLDMVFQ